MRKFFLPLLCAVALGGCAKHGGWATNFILKNHELTQLKGRHILDIEKYAGGWVDVEIGAFSNKYYMQSLSRIPLSRDVSCNFYGCTTLGTNWSTYGYIYFTTDKDGFITDYTEDGDEIKVVKHKFKDILVLEN